MKGWGFQTRQWSTRHDVIGQKWKKKILKQKIESIYVLSEVRAWIWKAKAMELNWPILPLSHHFPFSHFLNATTHLIFYFFLLLFFWKGTWIRILWIKICLQAGSACHFCLTSSKLNKNIIGKPLNPILNNIYVSRHIFIYGLKMKSGIFAWSNR